MEPKSFICLNCQTPLRLEASQRRPDSIDPEIGGHSRNLMKIIGDAQYQSDAPVCKECADALLKEMDAQMASLEDECASYRTYIDFLKENHPSSSIPELKTQLQNLQDEEKDLEAQLQRLILEEEQVDAELQQKRKAAETNSVESVELWKKFRDNLRKVMEGREELIALDAEKQYAEIQSRKLMDTNILDLCFHIWIEGNIGEINGFRLGCLKETPIEWNEINAALGQVVLLLEILFERLGIQHPELVPVAMGSHSYIKSRRNGINGQSYQMYGQGTMFCGTSLVDAGITRYLKLLEFLQRELKDRNKLFKPPYQIHTDGLIDNGVRYCATMILNTDVRWTRSMALMLANLKAAMAQCEALRAPA